MAISLKNLGRIRPSLEHALRSAMGDEDYERGLKGGEPEGRLRKVAKAIAGYLPSQHADRNLKLNQCRKVLEAVRTELENEQGTKVICSAISTAEQAIMDSLENDR